MTKAEAAAINRMYGRGFAALRTRAGFTQTSLATATPYAQATISEIERGDRALKTHEIEWWLAFFADQIEGYDEAACWDQLRGRGDFRPHLKLVKEDGQPDSDEDEDGSSDLTVGAPLLTDLAAA